MKRSGWGAVAGLGLPMAVRTAQADEETKTGRPGPTATGAKEAGPKEAGAITGRVEKYDRQTRTLTLSGSDKKLLITDDTEVSKDGQKVSPGQIMEGDQVRASGAGTGDTVRVERLEVITGGATGNGARGAGASGGGRR